MRSKFIDTESTTSGFYAVLAYKDALRINSNWRSTYSEAQKLTVAKAESILDLAYKARAVYVNYRKTGIAIKLDHPLVRDRSTLTEVEDILEELHFTKRESAQGVIYSLKRI